MSGSIVDSFMTSFRRTGARQRGAPDAGRRYIPTKAGQLRVMDTGSRKPVLVLTPDGPCVIEHYTGLIKSFSESFRVICFELPGTGFSFPNYGYRFRMAEAADAIVELLDALSVSQAAVAFTCANGFIAMNLAKRYPQRVSHLVLAQTPSFESMRPWTDRNIPKAVQVPYLGQVITAVKAGVFVTRWFNMALPRGSQYKGEFVAQAQQALHAGGCFCLASTVQGLLLQGRADEVRGVQCLTLAIYGDSDFSHKHTDFRSISDSIPQAQVLTFPGCGHFPDLERRSDYVDQVQRFLRCHG